MLGDAGRLADLKDWGGKLCGLTARLAGLFHLIDNSAVEDPSVLPVERDSIERAIVLSRWAIDHAEAVVSLMGAEGQPLNDARYVLRWLRARGNPQVSQRDIAQHGRARFDRDPARLDACLMVLLDRGWIRGIDKGDRGRGRPSVGFEVNPRVFKGLERVPITVAVPSSSGGRVRGML